MSVREVTYYTVVCDECGADFNEGQEYTAWSDKDSATLVFEDSAISARWSASPDETQHRCDKHNPYCTRCGMDAGTLCGERDYLCPTCWETEKDR